MAAVGKVKQLVIEFRPWGGKRKGSGRKRRSPRTRVLHRPRPRHVARFPLHVTLRIRPGLPNLRHPLAHAVVLRSFVSATGRFGLQVVHYSVMSNHIHLVCEAANKAAISLGMAALKIRLAKSLNRLWKRKGTVFAERYHCRRITTPTEMRNILAYVLLNAHHHGLHHPGGIDPCSSARWFDGWEGPLGWTLRDEHPCPLPRPTTWLLTTGWKRLGLLDPIADSRPRRAPAHGCRHLTPAEGRTASRPTHADETANESYA